MGDTVQFVLHLSGGGFEFEGPRKLAERIQRLEHEEGISVGRLWDWSCAKFGEELEPYESPELYSDCETTHDAKEKWACSVLKRGVENAPDSLPELHESRASEYRIDEVLT